MDERTFLQSAIGQFMEYKQLGDKTFSQLKDNDFYFQPNEYTNSIAINITHLHGNMVSRWTNFLTEDGEKPWRQREEEFETHGYDRSKLLALWNAGWEIVFQAMTSLGPQDLTKIVYIRTQPLTVTAAILRQLTHYAYHVGQIVLLGKMILGPGWESLSIPKGATIAFNDAMRTK